MSSLIEWYTVKPSTNTLKHMEMIGSLQAINDILQQQQELCRTKRASKRGDSIRDSRIVISCMMTIIQMDQQQIMPRLLISLKDHPLKDILQSIYPPGRASAEVKQLVKERQIEVKRRLLEFLEWMKQENKASISQVIL